MHPVWRRLVHFHFGEDAAGGRIPARKVDARRFPNDAAAAVTADEKLSAQRLAAGEHDVDARRVLLEAGDLPAVQDRHVELGDPARQDALNVFLPQPEAVRVARGEVADVQTDSGEPGDLGHLPFRKEPVCDSALVEDLDGA